MDAELKYSIFLEILKKYPRVFIHVMPHNGLIIGRRGLVEDETRLGILLVFGPQSYKNLAISGENLFVDMKFSGIWEKLSIPLDSIYAIFDSPSDPDFIFNFKCETETAHTATTTKKSLPTEKSGKVIKIDFGKN